MTLYVQNNKPGEEQCDFCDSRDVQWVFPCRDHRGGAEIAEAVIVQADDSSSVKRMSISAVLTGDWAACPACHALILRGDRQRLARRAAKRIKAKYAAMTPPIIMPLNNLTAHIRRRQDDFWANRQGPPFPASEADRIRHGRTP
jgi:hypothetical protein